MCSIIFTICQKEGSNCVFTKSGQLLWVMRSPQNWNVIFSPTLGVPYPILLILLVFKHKCGPLGGPHLSPNLVKHKFNGLSQRTIASFSFPFSFSLLRKIYILYLDNNIKLVVEKLICLFYVWSRYLSFLFYWYYDQAVFR